MPTDPKALVEGTVCIEWSNPIAFTIDDPRLEPCPTTGCWLWTRCTNEHGYGVTDRRVRGRRAGTYAHRLAWEKAHGPIAEGLVVDHVCRVRSCVNPGHMRLLTPRENTMASGSQARAKRQSDQRQCPSCGGAYESFTVTTGMWAGKTSRICRPCKNAGDRHRRAWKRATGRAE